MTDSTSMRARARRMYERGRGVAALRVAFVIVPLAALCARETEAPWRCGAVGVALLAVCTAARWRQYRGVRAVDTGLMTGVIPMTAALLLCRFAASWSDNAAVGICGAAGLLSGALIGRTIGPDADARSTQWVTASLAAGLTAALGCVGIGIGTAVGAAAGVVAGAIVAAEMPHASAAS
jgi:hypothetical protein